MVVTEVVPDKVVLHPLVLLSVADHFSRMGKTFEHVPTEIGAKEAEEVGGGCDMILGRFLFS